MYSKQSLLNWFHRTSGVNNRPNQDEVQTNCPLCGSDVLYFNIKKKVGLCHRASCEWHEKVFLSDLIEVFGFAPDQGGEWESQESIPKKPVSLPGYPILIQRGTQRLTYNQDALNYLRGRGIDDLVTLNWGLTCDGSRIYVPILDEMGQLVNYNSRLLNNFDSKYKYLYFPGAKTSHYILGWAESRNWEDLALVENTFVSLAYRARMHCSTTFGSNVSDIQADLIAESGIKRVAILWDENAEEGADRALRRFDDRGIRAAYWKILRQPDDYPVKWVEEKCKQIKWAADNGVRWIDFREECEEICNEN